MAPSKRVPAIILGAGMAGYTLARELRKRSPTLPLAIVTRDDGAAYSKPTLSGALAGGRAPAALATASAEAMAATLSARVLTHREVAAIDPAARAVTLADGTRLPWRALVLALGADPLRAPLAGEAAHEVHAIDDLAGYERFHAAARGARHVTVMGAGLIGCEFANDLAAGGIAVEVVDPGPWPLARLLPRELGEAFGARLAAAGIGLRHGLTVASVGRGAGGRLEAALDDGSRLATDAVLSAIGRAPRTALARAAGLACGRGVTVDRTLRTSAPDVYAIGDCAEVDGHVLPYVLPLVQQARALARTLAEGEPVAVAYPAMPVTVKTPAAPLTVASPPPGAQGRWRITRGADGSLEAAFLDACGELLGFALLGGTPAACQALTRRLPALFG